MVAEADESLMEKFFEAGTLTQEELTKGLATATRAATIVPLVCTSGLQNIGAQPLMDAILAYLPSPADRPFAAVANKETVTKNADDKAPYAAFVWKTVADQFAGRITMFRVYQGCLKADSTVTNATQGTPERLGHLIVLQGKTATNVPELKAGDLGAVAKLKDTRTNDTLADKGAGITFAPIAFPEPVLSYAIEPKSRGDEDKISTAMHRLEEEDSTIKYQRDPQTHELLLAGQGQMHIEVDGGEAQTPLRRRGAAQTATHSLPRDHHLAGRGARPPQEADRRPRPVRRLQDQDGAAAARQRVRVRRRDLRRLDPARLHSRGREGHPGIAAARLPRRLSRGRFPRHAVRRLVPRRRLERTVVQDRRLAGVQGRHVARQADAARADHERRRFRRPTTTPAT